MGCWQVLLLLPLRLVQRKQLPALVQVREVPHHAGRELCDGP